MQAQRNIEVHGTKARDRSVKRIGVLLVLAVAGFVTGALVLACSDDGGSGNENGGTPTATVEGTQGATATPEDGLSRGPGATSTAAAVATRITQVLDVPVLSQDLLPDWQEEGEFGANLTQVCPPDELKGLIRINNASRLLRGPDDERARSAVVRLSEVKEVDAYSQKLIGGAPTCARQLAQSWFGEDRTFAGAPAASAGEESAVVVSSGGAPAAAAVFFRRYSIVVAVLQFGGDAEGSARDLAGMLDQEIVRLGQAGE